MHAQPQHMFTAHGEQPIGRSSSEPELHKQDRSYEDQADRIRKNQGQVPSQEAVGKPQHDSQGKGALGHE